MLLKCIIKGIKWYIILISLQDVSYNLLTLEITFFIHALCNKYKDLKARVLKSSHNFYSTIYKMN